MITYNNRYRGPFEYEKFLLNILSFHNIVNEINICENEDINNSIIGLKSIQQEINNIYNSIVNNGLDEKLYIIIKQNRGVKYDT